MKMKVVYLFVAVCIGFFGVFTAGCKDKSIEINPIVTKNYEVILESTLYSGEEICANFIGLCNSFDEFKEECLRNDYNFFDSINKENNYFNTDAGEKIREYTDEYFENNAFVVCAFYKGSWSGQYHIEEVKVVAEKLTLFIESPDSNIAYTVINKVFLIAGIEKSLVSDVTHLEYILR